MQPLWQIIASALVPPFIGVVFSLLMFLFPRSVTNKLVAGAPLSSPQTFEAVQYAALRIVGIYFIYRGGVDLVFFLVKMYARDADYVSAYGASIPVRTTPDDIAGVVSSLAEVLFALWLVLGARGILGFFDRLRGTVREKETEEQ